MVGVSIRGARGVVNLWPPWAAGSVDQVNFNVSYDELVRAAQAVGQTVHNVRQQLAGAYRDYQWRRDTGLPVSSRKRLTDQFWDDHERRVGSKASKGPRYPVRKAPRMPARFSSFARSSLSSSRRRSSRSSSFRRAKKYRFKKKALPSVPRPVRRDWPPEVVRVSIPTTTQLEIQESVNSNLVGVSCFSLGTAIDRSTWLKHWADSAAASPVQSGTTCIGRGFADYSTDYEMMRCLRVVHYLTFWVNDVSNDSHIRIYMVKSSTNADHQPFDLSITSARTAAPYDSVDDLVTKLENYRHTYKKEIINQSGLSTGAVKMKSIPFLYRDNVGQRAIGGKFNDDSTGTGQSTAYAVASTDQHFGLAGYDHFFVVSSDLSADIASPNVYVEVKTYHLLEFYRRITRANTQTGDYVNLISDIA